MALFFVFVNLNIIHNDAFPRSVETLLLAAFTILIYLFFLLKKLNFAKVQLRQITHIIYCFRYVCIISLYSMLAVYITFV
jgi:hypothetical protein